MASEVPPWLPQVGSTNREGLGLGSVGVIGVPGSWPPTWNWVVELFTQAACAGGGNAAPTTPISRLTASLAHIPRVLLIATSLTSPSNALDPAVITCLQSHIDRRPGFGYRFPAQPGDRGDDRAARTLRPRAVPTERVCAAYAELEGLAIAIRSFSALGEREQLRISEPPSVTVGRLVRTDPIVRSSSRLANCRVLMNRLTPHATRVSIGANEPVVNRESALKVAATRVSAITCARWRRKRVLKRGATPSTSESGASPTRYRASVSVQRFA